MCYYIALILPNDKELEKVREILYDYNMTFSQINNKSLKSYLKAEQLIFRPTKEYCDCNTVLGAFNRKNEYEKLLESQKVRNLRKKKWNQKQIDNWIWEKLNKTTPHVKKSITPMEQENEIIKWFNFLHELVNLEKFIHIGILKHWYHSTLDNEEIILKRKQKVNLNEVDKNFLLYLEEDVLYEFFIPLKR
ncbi:MAG: hypothetical protein ACFFAK_18095 [Promethearchaeota archaeon]